MLRRRGANQENVDELVTWERLTAGALAGMTSVLSTYPLDLIRTRLSLSNHSYSGIIDCGRRLVREEGGVFALFRGLNATLLGVAPYIGLNFAVYETLKEKWRLGLFPNPMDLLVPNPSNPQASRTQAQDSIEQQHRGGQPALSNTPSNAPPRGRELSHAAKFVFGGIAGAISQTITYPLDVLRRKMQVVSMKGMVGGDVSAEASAGPRRIGLVDVIRAMWAKGGVREFYRGLIPNYLKVIPAMSVSFVSYEWTKTALSEYCSAK